MKTKNVRNIIKIFLTAIGTLITADGILLCFVSNFNLGNILTSALGMVFVLCGVYLDFIIKKVPQWTKILFVTALAAVFAFVIFLLGYGVFDNVTYSEDAIIVLGAAVHGEEVSLTLADRLDAAIEYYEKNPDAVIVVSGGQGAQEDIPEAWAMAEYLIKSGVPENKILKEDKSTSTFENFKNSKEILDDYFKTKYSAAFVTNEYHTYRASGISRATGFEQISHYHSSTRWYGILPGTLRECLAVLKFWVFKT